MKKNNFCTIYLVRHGRTDWNKKGLIQGHMDIPLNIEGEKEVEELAKELKHIKFDKVFSSDLLRAKQTAQIIASNHKLETAAFRALRERAFGDFEGKPFKMLKEFDEILDSLEASKRFSYKHHPKIESDKELMDRFLIFLRKISTLYLGKNILVITHGGLMRTLLIALGESEYNHRLHIGNLSYIKLESDGIDFFVRETKGIEAKE